MVFGERSLTKVAGLYPPERAARDAQARLAGRRGWEPSQVRLLGPDDARMSRRSILSRKVEPESQGIWRTIVRAHVVAGLAGVLLGAGGWYLFWRAGNRLLAASPGLSLLAAVFFGAVFGLLVGGLIALRPDHARLITLLRTALRGGGWAVVAHAQDDDQAEDAARALRPGSERIERTL